MQETSSPAATGPGTSSGKPGRGRPRDPDLETKVFDVAVSLYAEAGWSGFNFERIAKIAGVGKAALYDRWRTREDLFQAAFLERWKPLNEIDTGTLSGDLEQLIDLTMQRVLTTRGGVVLNFQADGRRHPEFRVVARPFYTVVSMRTRQIFENARARGEVAADLDVDNASLLIHGAIAARIARWEMFETRVDQAEVARFCETLLGFVMQGVARRKNTEPG